MGILKQSREQGAGLSRVEREVTVSAFCRRRLAVIMARSGMVENVKTVRFSSLSFLFCPAFFFFAIFGLLWLCLGCLWGCAECEANLLLGCYFH